MKKAILEPPASRHLPRPVIQKIRWPFLLVWIVPIVAAVAVCFYVYDYRQTHGPEITVRFNDGSGLKQGETPLRYLGVQVGTVSALELRVDHPQVLVHIQLQRSREDFAKEGAKFWIVRPEFSDGSISGLSTVVTGPYVAAMPGNGALAKDFTGLESAPAAQEPGLKVILRIAHLEHLQPNSVVHFRGIDVGVVQNIQLSNDATGVEVQLLIRRNYTQLVRSNTQFWLESGADVKGGLLSGVEVKLDSLRALLSGAIAFATPSPAGEQAEDGMTFPLREEPDKDAANWAPQIPLSPEGSTSLEKDNSVQKARSLLSVPKAGGSPSK